MENNIIILQVCNEGKKVLERFFIFKENEKKKTKLINKHVNFQQ